MLAICVCSSGEGLFYTTENHDVRSRGKKNSRVKYSFPSTNTIKIIRKEKNYLEWHEKHVTHLWSPKFTSVILEMAKL
jgi:hypothetical protein